MPTTDEEILQVALPGLQHQLQQVDTAIADIRRKLRVKPAATSNAPAKRILSAAARRQMATVQKRRWAAYRKQKAA